MANIKLSSVSLDIPIYGTSARSFKKSFLSLTTGGIIKFSEKNIINVRALDNITLNISKGDRIGLIGHNGAGKSTLLRLLSGIYHPTAGSINVTGDITSIIDINAGLEAELTGMDNIYLKCTHNGLKRSEIKDIIKDIAEFSDLGQYLNMPLRTYSSGMQLRLSFAIATAFSPDILLIDEVIGVGDTNFQAKAKIRIAKIVKKTQILFVSSHDLNIIKSYCNKCLWLEKGKVKLFSDVDSCVEQYLKHMQTETI
jgi:lipopolysaccharide transport system ATP-binding protein